MAHLRRPLLIALLSSTFPVYAYIDPGTGSLLIQSIIGAIAAVAVTMKLYWHKLKLFLFRKKEPATEDSSEEPGS